MHAAMVIVSIASASLAGSAIGYWGLARYEQQKIARSCRIQAGVESTLQNRCSLIQVEGLWRQVILIAVASSSAQHSPDKPPAKIWLVQADKLEAYLKKAGLKGEIDLDGCARTRMALSLGGAGAGFLLGMLFSGMLALMLLCLGFIVGYRMLQSALKQEIAHRTTSVEQELSQLVEVLVLGLRSGLSFDRSLEMYCHYFSCGLSDLAERLQTQWNHGLISRDEGLRTLASSYDSPLLERIVESIIRSLRFGTSMAETLSNAGAEIRTARKTKLEEKAAKAPVKMLVPIGTLILPAMLILILGPIILELVGGI